MRCPVPEFLKSNNSTAKIFNDSYSELETDLASEIVQFTDGIARYQMIQCKILLVGAHGSACRSISSHQYHHEKVQKTKQLSMDMPL
jgi:hypothetical protein